MRSPCPELTITMPHRVVYCSQVPIDKRSKSQLARELKAVELQRNQLLAQLNAAKQEGKGSATNSPSGSAAPGGNMIGGFSPQLGATPIGGAVPFAATGQDGPVNRLFGAVPMGGAAATAAAERDAASAVGRRRNSAPPIWGRSNTSQW
jgi:hypothetical protein